jgi:TM2 domain-containing membrane protein YozV
MYAPVPLKNAGIAAILALIIPGAGHIYDGKLTEGIMYLVLSVVLWVIGILTFFGLIIVLFFYLWQVYDAFNKANLYNTTVQQTGRAPW